jgi:DNA replicative helicase MCM subunit Mcm2 (Cdc46/Mcm family)
MMRKLIFKKILCLLKSIFLVCCNLFQYNVALPPAILSRFDLVYIMIDEPDENTDYHIAHHIVRVHQKREEALAPAFSTAQLKRYISFAKSLKPQVCLFTALVKAILRKWVLTSHSLIVISLFHFS